MQLQRIVNKGDLEYWDNYSKNQQVLTSIPTEQERRFMEHDPDIGQILKDGGSFAISTVASQSADGTMMIVIARWIFVRDKDENLKAVLIWHWY